MNQEIDKIKAFRKEHKGKCVSTSHYFSFNDFLNIGKELKKTFKIFSVEVREKDVEVKIPMFRRRV